VVLAAVVTVQRSTHCKQASKQVYGLYLATRFPLPRPNLSLSFQLSFVSSFFFFAVAVLCCAVPCLALPCLPPLQCIPPSTNYPPPSTTCISIPWTVPVRLLLVSLTSRPGLEFHFILLFSSSYISVNPILSLVFVVNFTLNPLTLPTAIKPIPHKRACLNISRRLPTFPSSPTSPTSS
jgi:hypothetical protein